MSSKWNIWIVLLCTPFVVDTLTKYEYEHLVRAVTAIIRDSKISNRLLIYANYNQSVHSQKHHFNGFIERIVHNLNNITVNVFVQYQKKFRNSINIEVLLFSDVDAIV